LFLINNDYEANLEGQDEGKMKNEKIDQNG